MLQTHKDCVVHLSFETTFLLKHIILPHYCLARLSIGGKIALPMTVSKLPGPSVSPPSLFSESSLSKVLQTDVDCRRDGEKLLSWVTAGHQSAPVGLEWLPSSSGHILTHIDLGKMNIDPRASFQTVWLNQKCWYLKNAQKDVECRRGVKGWLSAKLGYSWPWASTRLQLLPSGLKSTFTRTDLGKMPIDPRPFFQPAWLNQSAGI